MMRDIFGGIAGRFRRHRTAPASGVSVVFESPGLFPAGAHSTVLVTVLGIDPMRLDEILDRALTVLSGYDLVVFLTDRPGFLPFRRRRVPFEYLPPAAFRTGPNSAADWARYLDTRYQLILSKWQPVRVVSYGDTVAEFVGGPARAR